MPRNADLIKRLLIKLIWYNLLSLAPEPYEPSMRWLVNLHLGIQFNLMLQLPEMQNVYNRMSLLFYFETPGGL